MRKYIPAGEGYELPWFLRGYLGRVNLTDLPRYMVDPLGRQPYILTVLSLDYCTLLVYDGGFLP